MILLITGHFDSVKALRFSLGLMTSVFSKFLGLIRAEAAAQHQASILSGV